ncbi:ABC transporter permease [Jhaorihella thermophila]|uniref:Transport permease protein n=1 Tax=Jhaorihella thermophila TaxID=488547 RepID=A0A1H5Y635_9RHOB|nr:ABC transporter permease [Jhaorihella thermophila]SEG19529.1 capsular polysaccharide transport system permease protein [Jhaorihella thermophila]
MSNSVQILRFRWFRPLRTITALMLREMSTTYGRSAAGYLWAIIEPVAALALLSIAFALFLRHPSLGTNFPLFYASGYLVFNLYMNVGNKVAQAVSFSKPLLEFPAVTPLDTILARFLLNYLTQLMVSVIIFGGIIAIYDLRLILDFPTIVLAYLAAGAFTLGIGTFNCYLFAAYPSYVQVWAILNRPMFLVSGIFFMFDIVPQPYRDILWFNPLIHLVGLLRSGIYATYDAPYVSLVYVMGVSGILFAVGLLMLNRHIRDAMNR